MSASCVGRKRCLSNPETALRKVQSLSAAASCNAPDPNYLDPGPGSHPPIITERQREKVVKYINELAEDFELCVSTGSLACNYFDRYVATLSPSAAINDKHSFIQTIASTCLLIAAKFFDRKLPPLSELRKVHRGQVSEERFAKLELDILDRLRWKLHVPLPHAFTEHLLSLCAEAPRSPQIDDKMLFFIDLSVYGYDFLRFPPAAIAAAAIITAWKFSGEAAYVQMYTSALASAAGVDDGSLSGCVNSLIHYYQQCFPEAAHASQAALFIPIPNERDEMVSPASTCPTPPVLREGAPASPTEQLAATELSVSTAGPPPAKGAREEAREEADYSPVSVVIGTLTPHA